MPLFYHHAHKESYANGTLSDLTVVSQVFKVQEKEMPITKLLQK